MSDQAQAGVINLGPDLGIETADELKASLLKKLGNKRAVVLNGEQVERLHAASLQLLSAFVRDRQAAGLEVQWDQASDCLNQAAHVLGLSAVLGLKPQTPSETQSPSTNPE